MVRMQRTGTRMRDGGGERENETGLEGEGGWPLIE